MKNLTFLATAILSFSTLSFAKNFTNADLESTLSQEQQGIIYIWNPLMPLSTMGLKEAKAIAQELNLHFTELVDPSASALVPDSDTLNSDKLVRMGVMNHFPAIAVYNNGKLKSSIIQGYEAPEGLREFLKQILKSGNVSFQKRHSFLNLKGEAKIIPSLVKKTVHINKVPSFFFKVAGDGKYLSYTLPKNYSSQVGSEGTNYLVNTTSKVTTKIPGPWDPVFNVDSTLMTLPLKASRDVYYQTYKLKDLVSEGVDASPIHTDKKFTGLYQSASILTRTNGQIKYRIIAENHNGKHSMREYTQSLSDNSYAYDGELKQLCYNQTIKLPMISKNGKEVGGIDMSTGTTSIFAISDDGSCRKVWDLDIKTGKVNFSFDSRYITYHLYNQGGNPSDYTPVPNAFYSSDIYIYDRVDRKTYQVTENTDANSLYPDFTRDGKLVFAYYPQNSDKGVDFKFLEIPSLVQGGYTGVDTLASFEKGYDKLTTKEEKVQFFKDNLIQNDQIRINFLPIFNKILEKAIEVDLVDEYVKKSIEDGMNLKSPAFAKALYTNNVDVLVSFINNEAQGTASSIKALFSELGTIGKSGELYNEVNKYLITQGLDSSNSVTYSYSLVKTFIQDSKTFSKLLLTLLNKGLKPELNEIADLIKTNKAIGLSSAIATVYKSEMDSLVNLLLSSLNNEAKAVISNAIYYGNYKTKSCSTLKTLKGVNYYNTLFLNSVSQIDCSAADLYKAAVEVKDGDLASRIDAIQSSKKDPNGTALLSFINNNSYSADDSTVLLKSLVKMNKDLPSASLESLLGKTNSSEDLEDKILILAQAKRWDVLTKYEPFMISQRSKAIMKEAYAQGIEAEIIQRNYAAVIQDIKNYSSYFQSKMTDLVSNQKLKLNSQQMGDLLITLQTSGQFSTVFSGALKDKNFSLKDSGLLEAAMKGDFYPENTLLILRSKEAMNYAAEMRGLFTKITTNYDSFSSNSIYLFIKNVKVKTSKNDKRTLKKTDIKEENIDLFRALRKYIRQNK